MEIVDDGRPQQAPHVGQHGIPGGVAGLVLLEEVLARAFSRDDDGVPAQFEAPFQRGEQAAVAVQLERRFGDEHEVGLTQGEGGLRRDESGLAAHELDDADAVGRAHGFHMRAADGFGGLVHGGVETKGLRHEIDVVVDGLGDADDGNADVALAYFLGDGGGGLHGAVAADDEEDAHVEPFERIDDFGRFLRPSGGAEERSRRTGKYARRWLASAPLRCGCRRG